jgi:DNA-directed RNA polymerase sigma subunit (sigma70/sigma32)
MILRARYGLDGSEESLRDIGERIGLSGERVRQIEQRAWASFALPPRAASATGHPP